MADILAELYGAHIKPIFLKALSPAYFPVHLLLMLFGMSLLTGCIAAAEQSNQWAFTCPDDYEFTATFSPDSESVTLEDESQEYSLDHKPSASGALYTDGTTVFWNKGLMARVEMADGVLHLDCQGDNGQ